MQANGNYTGLAFYYGMIIKDIFFFDMPEQASLMQQGVLRNETPLLEGYRQREL